MKKILISYKDYLEVHDLKPTVGDTVWCSGSMWEIDRIYSDGYVTLTSEAYPDMCHVDTDCLHVEITVAEEEWQDIVHLDII